MRKLMKQWRHMATVLIAITVASAQQRPPAGVYELAGNGSRITIAPFGAGNVHGRLETRNPTSRSPWGPQGSTLRDHN